MQINHNENGDETITYCQILFSFRKILSKGRKIRTNVFFPGEFICISKNLFKFVCLNLKKSNLPPNCTKKLNDSIFLQKIGKKACYLFVEEFCHK